MVRPQRSIRSHDAEENEDQASSHREATSPLQAQAAQLQTDVITHMMPTFTALQQTQKVARHFLG